LVGQFSKIQEGLGIGLAYRWIIHPGHRPGQVTGSRVRWVDPGWPKKIWKNHTDSLTNKLNKLIPSFSCSFFVVIIDCHRRSLMKKKLWQLWSNRQIYSERGGKGIFICCLCAHGKEPMVNHVQLYLLGWQSSWGGPEVGTLLLKPSSRDCDGE